MGTHGHRVTSQKDANRIMILAQLCAVELVNNQGASGTKYEIPPGLIQENRVRLFTALGRIPTQSEGWDLATYTGYYIGIWSAGVVAMPTKEQILKEMG